MPGAVETPEVDTREAPAARPSAPTGDAPQHEPKRVEVTDEAAALIEHLRGLHGDLMFHQSGGCCDGSSPMCYPDGEFKVGGSDVHLGEVADCPFYMGAAQFELWKHTRLILDVVDGRGGGFSLEAPEGKRFLIRSEVMDDGERQRMDTACPVTRMGSQD